MQYRQIFVIYEKKICIVTIFLDIKAKGFLFDSMLDHIFGDIRFCQLCSSSKSIQRAWTANPADDKCTNPMDDKSTNPNVSRQTINPELVRTRYVGSPIGHTTIFAALDFHSVSQSFFPFAFQPKSGKDSIQKHFHSVDL